MGQSQSHRNGSSLSDDRINLFIPHHDSITSLASEQIYDDVITKNYRKQNKYKSCRKLSKLKKSFSECFRSKFTQLQEVESGIEASSECEVTSVLRPHSEMSNVVVTESRVRRLSDCTASSNQSIPKDIQEIHFQLTELKKLLSRPDIVDEPIEKRDKSCQASNGESTNEHLLRQRDCLIANQQDQLNNLRINLENRTKMAESFAKEITILRNQQSRRNIDIEPKVVDQFITLLKCIRQNRKLDNCDLEKFDEGLNIISSLSNSSRNLIDKSNVAIINPCSKNNNNNSDILIEKTINLSTVSDNTEHTQSIHTSSNPFIGQLKEETISNPFIGQLKDPIEICQTKIMYYLADSNKPYLSTIPYSPSKITLANVKQFTNSISSNQINLRYFFKTINAQFQPIRKEICRDDDIVPLIDGKIVVFIQQ